jgi:hypothetical protein
LRPGFYEAGPRTLVAVGLIVACMTAATAVATGPAFSLEHFAVSTAMRAGGSRPWPPTAADAIAYRAGMGDQGDDDVADDATDGSLGLDDLSACNAAIAAVGRVRPIAETSRIVLFDARVHTTRAPPRISPAA